MGFVVLISAAIAILLLAQGIYTLATGQTDPLLGRSRPGRVSLPSRAVYGMVYLGMSAALISIWVAEGLRYGVGPLQRWFAANSGMFACSALFVLVGTLTVIRPDLALRWTGHSERAADRRHLISTRVIGAIILFMGLITLATL